MDYEEIKAENEELLDKYSKMQEQVDEMCGFQQRSRDLEIQN